MENEDYFLSSSVYAMFTEFYNREGTLGYYLSFPFYLIFLVIAFPVAVIADVIMFVIYPYSDKSRAKWQLGLLIMIAVFMIVWVPFTAWLHAMISSIPYSGGKRR